MSAYFWIFTGLAAVDILLYLIGLIKNIVIMEKICRFFIIPFFSVIAISLLLDYLPDSRHVIELTGWGLILFSICTLWTICGGKKIFLFLEVLFFICGTSVWSLLIFPTYRIFRISDLTFIIAGVASLIAYITLCIFTGRQKLRNYFVMLLGFLPVSFFLFTSVLSANLEGRIYNFTNVAAAIALLGLYILYCFQKQRPLNIGRRTENFLSTLLLVLSQVLLSASSILMFIK